MITYIQPNIDFAWSLVTYKPLWVRTLDWILSSVSWGQNNICPMLSVFFSISDARELVRDMVPYDSDLQFYLNVSCHIIRTEHVCASEECEASLNSANSFPKLCYNCTTLRSSYILIKEYFGSKAKVYCFSFTVPKCKSEPRT